MIFPAEFVIGLMLGFAAGALFVADIVWHEEFFTGKVTWCLTLHGYDGAEWTEIVYFPFCGAKLTSPEPPPTKEG